MARKRHSDEDVLKLLREIELKLTVGDDVGSACRSVGISDATYYNWRKRFGGMGRSQLSELRSLAKLNAPTFSSLAASETASRTSFNTAPRIEKIGWFTIPKYRNTG